MPTKDIDDGRIYIPESDKERKLLECLIEKGLVEYHEGGYWIPIEVVNIINKKLKQKG